MYTKTEGLCHGPVKTKVTMKPALDQKETNTQYAYSREINFPMVTFKDKKGKRRHVK